MDMGYAVSYVETKNIRQKCEKKRDGTGQIFGHKK